MKSQKHLSTLTFFQTALLLGFTALNLHAEQYYSPKELQIINETGLPYHAQIRAYEQTEACLQQEFSINSGYEDCPGPFVNNPDPSGVFSGTDKLEKKFTLTVGDCCKYIHTEAYLWINGENKTVCSHTHENNGGHQVWKYTLTTSIGPDGKPRYGCK